MRSPVASPSPPDRDVLPPPPPPDGLPGPAGTTVTFGLLVALLLLSATFIGQSCYATISVGPRAASLLWLAVPPVVVALLATALVLAQPGLTLRRRHLTEVPDDAPGAVRFRSLALEAGVTPPPRLVWDSRSAAVGALTFGRPGHHCIQVSPALLGAARRRPRRFDPVLRHELAHVRARDVAPAFVTLHTWHALLPALAVPPLLWVLVGDLSLAPQYLVRVGVLALVVQTVRTHLLRQREHYADVRAATWSPDREAYAVLVATPHAVPAAVDSPGLPRLLSRRPRWFALHPAPARRGAVVRDPGLLARPSPLTLLLAGLVTGAGLPLLHDLLAATPGFSPVGAERGARLVLYALLGAAVTAEVLRSVERPVPRGPLALGAPALGLTAGLAAGSFVSLAGTGLLQASTQEAMTAGLTGLLVGAAAVAVLDVAGQRRRPRPALHGWTVVAGALLTALLADAATTASVLVGAGAGGAVMEQAVSVLQVSWSPLLLAAAAPVVAVLALRGRVGRPLATGGATGLLAAAAAVALRLRAGSLEADPAAVAYLTWTVWLVVGVAAVGAGVVAAHRDAAAGLLASAAAMLGASWLLVLTGPLLGGMLRLDDLLRLVAPLTLAGALPAVAVGALIRSTGRRAPRAVRALTGALTAAALIGVALVVGPAAVDAEGRADPMTAYLTQDLPLLQLLRDDAFLSGQLAEMAPEVSLAADVRSTVLPLYDRALDEAADIGRTPRVLDDPDVEALHAAYVEVVLAERAAFLAEAEAFEEPSALTQQRQVAAVLAAQEAMTRWSELATAAQEAHGSSS